MKWKILVTWIITTYLCYSLVMSWMLWFSGKHRTDFWLMHWRTQGLLLPYCVVPAFLGIMILWALPIRRVLFGVLVGLVLAAGGIFLCGWLEMMLFGGFEENVGILVTGAVLLLPSCFMGAIGGVLRFREQQSKNPSSGLTLNLR